MSSTSSTLKVETLLKVANATIAHQGYWTPAQREAMQFLTEELLSAAKAMTYHVCVSSYSLAEGRVGEPSGEPVVVSRHRSLKAAGRMLGSVISGKRSVQYRGYQRAYVLDTESGREIPRVECTK